MTRTHATRRPGLSVLEVMTALFVAALGMLALLSLFPLGAVQMGQALRDARAAETVAQADTHMRLWWQKYVVENATPAGEGGYEALDNPRSATWDNSHPINALLPDTATTPSYPVVLDPIGWQAYPGTRQVRVSGGTAFPVAVPPAAQYGPLPRRSLNWILTSGQPAAFSFRVATMMDDITFGENAAPDVASTQGGQVDRQGRYNWLAVIQRPVNSSRNVADLKIAVFDGRPPGIAPADGELMFAPTGTELSPTQFVVAGTLPDTIRQGSWILDGTLNNAGVRNAFWYRIQGIDRDNLPGSTLVEVQTPLIIRPGAASAVDTNTRFYAFKGLLEVFNRPQLAPPGYKKQSP